MKKFHNIKSTAIPLPLEDIDTDQIIPARFLKSTTRIGFGDNLFRDWRYINGSTINDQFILNNPTYNGEILICGENFGCGSSREHAAWALYDYGIRVVVSSFFADIFTSNALNNGLLPVQLKDTELEICFKEIESRPDTIFVVDLKAQTFSLPQENMMFSFDIDPYKKMCMLNGYDDMDFLVSSVKEIEDFERNQMIY